MKKNLIILLVTFFVGSTAYSQNAAGVYSTDFRQLTLVQSGNRVTGTYESGNGKLEGTLSGTRLTGTWTNSGSKKNGRFEFVFVSDFSSFTGKYGYNESTPSSRWNGTKTSSPAVTQPAPTVSAPAPTASAPASTDSHVNVLGSWSSNGSRNHRGRANIWQEGNRFIVIVSWIDEERNLWKSYMGEGALEGRQMNFKVFPAVVSDFTVDQGYVYHWTISPDNQVITGYYTRNGKRTVDTDIYYKRVE